MADCKRKTANLFSDKLIGMTWWDGIITADERYILYIAEVKPNTEYTASGNNSVDNIMVTYYSVYPAEGQSSVESVRYVYPTNPTRSVATFTTPDDSRIKYAAVRFGSDATDVMFNLGSTAFPYEPYGWVHSLRKLSTDTDTITTLPADIYPNAATATVGLKGQMEQSGTPTSTDPIQPQETGERTANLCLVSQSNSIYYSTLNKYSVSGNSVNITGEALFGFICAVSPNTEYSVSARTDNSGAQIRIREYSDIPTKWQTNFVKQSVNIGLTTYNSATFTTDATTKYLLVAFYVAAAYSPMEIYDIMLNSGSTTLPYEPYGVKIPISSASTTTPVYLGEVQTTRRIKKLVLTGEETWYSSSRLTGSMYAYNSQFPGIKGAETVYCSHLLYTPVSSYQYGTITTTDTDIDLWMFTETQSPAAFKAYLAQQYANGTPVTIWYVLATEETGIVNEPLRKIGDYADAVSGIIIPTITGKDTFDVQTTLKPSEVSLTYTGWHDAQCKEYDGSQWV